MSSDHLPDIELSELERRLGTWRPAGPGALDRDRLLFEAGRASAHGAGPRGWAWSAVSALLVAVSVGLCLGLVRERHRGARLERLIVRLQWEVRAAEGRAELAEMDDPGASVVRDLGPHRVVSRVSRIEPSSYLTLRGRWLAGEGPMPAQRDDGPTTPPKGPRRESVEPLRSGELGRVIDL